MYKKFNLEQLQTIQTQCFESIRTTMKKEKIPHFKQFLQTVTKIWKSTTYFERSRPSIRFEKHKKWVTIYDEQEKTQLEVTTEDIGILHWFLKDQKKINRLMKNNKSMMDQLRNDFVEGKFQTINDKPFVVYDIETTFASQNLKEAKFIIAYMITSQQKTTQFQYIAPNDYKRLFDFLINFPWYIIWYNHIHFDNPVLAYNVGAKKNEIEILNKKSIDPFLFINNKTGKKVWLNKVSQALIWLTKTLESGQQAEVLYNKYLETKDENYMKELKKYCKNDVKMTLLIMLYFLKFQKINIDGNEQFFSLQELITDSSNLKTKTKETKSYEKSIF